MNLENKDILVLIGPSRVGKGTLLEAIKGTKMKFWDDLHGKHPEYGEAANNICPELLESH